MRVFFVLCAIFATSLNSTTGATQTYPVRPIRLITSEAGGSTDFTARLLAGGMTPMLGQPVVVENRGGGGGAISALAVANASPDGYTLLFSAASLWIGPLINKAVTYDPIRDFTPILLATSSPLVVVVNPSVPIRSIKELIAAAKAKPGSMNYASGVTGSTSHLGPELFKSMTGTDLVRITYKGLGPSIADLIAGRVHLMFASAPAVTPHIRAGKLRALAVTSLKQSALLPGIPSVADSGVPGYEMTSYSALLGPAKLPAAIANRLQVEGAKSLKNGQARLLEIGVESVGGTAEELTRTIKAEQGRLAKVIKEQGIQNK